MQRHASTLRLKPEAEAEYRRYHRSVWPEVLHTITECNIRNYSIFLRDGILFSYFEYVGENFTADMAKMAADAKTQEWWAITNPMQAPLENRADGEWWAAMQEVFHTD
ncbi:MAG TPA: L-rhamnose mutarotase [Granulicella sp.]|jgi:L-rhamnose mutarotase|nr:L-rhamnose mutarotase [Granulicella sp.]